MFQARRMDRGSSLPLVCELYNAYESLDERYLLPTCKIHKVYGELGLWDLNGESLSVLH